MAVVRPADADIDWRSEESCRGWCEQRRGKLQRDVEALELMRDELMQSQKEVFVQGTCKLNKDVRNLSVKDFNATFGCDVIGLIRKQMSAGDVANSGSKRVRVPDDAVRAALGGVGASFKSPAAHLTGIPPTTMRTARRGEMVKTFSVNGSPLDAHDRGEMVVTAKKQRAADAADEDNSAGDGATSFPISIGIEGGNGRTIDLADPTQRNELDEEQKAQAMQQIMAIQKQMSELVANF